MAVTVPSVWLAVSSANHTRRALPPSFNFFGRTVTVTGPLPHRVRYLSAKDPGLVRAILLVERAPGAFADSKKESKSRERQLEEKVAALEERLAKKDAVIAEISEEYVHLKKSLGSLDRRVGSP